MLWMLLCMDQFMKSTITSDFEKKLLDEFKEIHPNFRFDRYEIQTDEEC